VLARRLQAARAAGAVLVLGSDAGEPAQLPARASWQEVEALVLEAHLTPAEAIRAATLDAAMVLGIDADTGSITPGKIADIIAVRGDLLRHIERLQDVELVIHRGLRYR
jgi:imidazolonepropionase-like amidohydrolase